jgi:hypothetical protein
MNISSALKSNRLCAAMTGLTIREFTNLVPVFASVTDVMRRERNPKRKRKFGAGHPSALRTPEEQLFFALFYLKSYPTVDVLSFLVGFDRSNACRNAQFLLSSLTKALGRKLVLPKRQITSVEEFFREFPQAKDIFIDGTERRVQKPVSQKRRKKLYSGKRKATTRKTVVVSDDKKRILVLTPTKSGRRHDKRLFDKAMGGRTIPSEVTAWTDTGFQGLAKDHANTVMPMKATKYHQLTEEERANNRLISGIRVLSEHAIGGIKRFRSTTDVYRNRITNLDDTFMVLSAGLWNYHLSMTPTR